MIVIAIDPGVTTGVAIWDTTAKAVVFSFEDISALAVVQRIDTFLDDTCLTDASDPEITLVIEDFIGAGMRTKEATETLTKLGFFWYYYLYRNARVVKRVPQSRNAYKSSARALLPGGHHTVDALAHAIAYAARLET